MRTLALLVMLVGCDSIWDLEHVEPVDASGLPADLAAWFPMEEVAGGTIVDVAGPHDGLCVATECPQVTTGRIGSALAFDGATQIVKAPSSVALDTKRSFTVAAWLRVAQAANVHACPVNKLYLGPDTDNAWQLCAYAGIWHFYASPVDLLGPPVAIDTWQHLAVTWDKQAARYRMHHNGLAVSEASGEPWLDDGGLVIGADIDAGQPLVYFPGAIDDVRIYTRALAGGEILSLATPR